MTTLAEHRPLDPRVGDARRTAGAAPTAPTPLADYLDALWGARWLLILVAVGAAGAALVVSLLLRPRFEATAMLLVSGSKLGNRDVTTLDVRNYQALVENQTLAAEMIEQFKLGQPPHELTPALFLQRVVSLSAVRGSDLLQLDITLTDPKIAADLANAMADRAVARSATFNLDETALARDLIKSQLDAARQKLTAARAALESYQQTAQVDLLQKELDAQITLQSALGEKIIAIAIERARLAKAEEELAKQEPIREGRRALRSAVPRAPDSTGRPVPLFREDAMDPYVNPVYENLQQEVASTRTRLAALERERDELQRGRNREGQLPRLAELYSRQARVDELKMQKDLAERVFVETATKYEQARMQVVGRSAQLQVVDRALPSDRKIFPRTALNVSAAFVLALSLVATAVVLVRAVSRLTAPSA